MSFPDLEPLAPDKALKTRVYESLRELIAGMDLDAGTDEIRLDERSLAARLGVSRTPVREALSRLEQEGLVRNIARRGSFVTRLDKAEILDIVEAWIALESHALRLLAQRATDAEIAALSREHATMKSTFSGRFRFHEHLVRLGHSSLLRRMIEPLLFQLRTVRFDGPAEEGVQQVLAQNHAQMLEALADRDAELAARLLREYALEFTRYVENHILDPE